MKITPFKLERFFARYEFKAPHLLCASDCESLSIQELLALEPGASERFQQHWLGYTESPGSPELRQAITGLYQTIDPDQVLVHSGAEEAIFNFMNAVLEPGDHVIVHFPCYQSLFEIARSIGCEVTRWETREADGWELDTDFLRRSIRPNTKAIIVNCPHNPSGYLMRRDKQRDIIEIAAAHNIVLFSDEVYRFLEYGDEDRLPAACDLYHRAVSLGVMSKAYGLAGLRIGWIAMRDQDIYNRMAYFKDYTTICSSAPGEFLAAVGLRQRDHLVQRNLAIINRNLALLDRFFAEHSNVFSWVRPKAGSIAFPRIKLDQGIDDFCADLVERKGVLLLPGTQYDYAGKHFRIGFGRSNFPEGLAKLAEYQTER